MTDCIFELVLWDSVTGQEVKEYILARDDEDAYDGLTHWLDRERYEILRCSPLPGLLCESVR